MLKLVNFPKARAWLAALALAAPAIGMDGVLTRDPAWAQSGYPDRPVRIIVPYGPGGVADVTMRIVAHKLSERLGQQFIVENRPGAGAIIAAQAGLSAPPDGYTLSMTGNNHAISASLFKALPYDTLRDFAPISTTTFFDILIATRAGSRLKTVTDVVSAARADPAHFNFGTVAPGSTQNLAVQLFKMVTGLTGSVVIYRTTPELLSGVLRGDVDVLFDYYAALQGPIVDRKLAVIATAGAARAPLLPDVPTVMESGLADYEVTSWNGLSAPTGTPPEIIQLLNREINEALRQPDVQARTRQVGVVARGSTPEEMHERTKADIAKWTAVIEKSGLARQ